MEQIQRVPFLDLHSQVQPIRGEILAAVAEAIDASDFVLGPRLESFEGAFARYCDCNHAAGVNSGTDALFLILRALNIGPGDEVITVPNMFIAAVEAIVQTGARAVLVDVDADTYCMDTAAVERALTKRTKAIIPVHLFGLPCDMDRLMELAQEHGVFVIEDACQAHGATYKGKKAGSLGHAAAFSFYPTKNLSGIGDGGAVTTNDEEIDARVRLLRHHAQSEKNTHTEIGYNSRLDSVQAAVLSVKLKHLDGWNESRRRIAARYRTKLDSSDYRIQQEGNESKSAYHIFAARHPRRDAVHARLGQSKIGWGKHIAQPVHQQPGYRFLGYMPGDFPVSEKLCDEVVSLPISPTLTDGEIDYVIDALGKVTVSV